MTTDREFMLGIAAAVSDGSDVDWARAQSIAETDEDKRLLRSLRLIAEISTVHDSMDLDAGAPARPAPSPGITGSAPVSSTTGRWGRYELREQLGSGAQGAVYHAWDPQLECEVALKVMHPRLAAADREGERMLREGRALAKVRHQNVVDVYAAEVHEGQIGLCMEFIRGRTLEEVLRAQGPFGEGEAVAVGLKVGHALSAVHAAGLVHRDIKARNVMREDRGRIVLMDFGTGRDNAQLAAGPGGLVGTPLYMAPEVLAGAASTQQSDIYSVGVLLYYLVTGHHPIEGRTLDEILQAHVRGRRTPVAERRADLRDDFIRIVDRALAPDPDARYETAAMLVHDLVSLDAQEAARVLPPRTVTQRVLLGTAWVGMAAIALTLIGFVTSMAFNIVLERVAVAHETPADWLIWGLRALVGPVWYIAQLVIEVLLVVAAWRLGRRFVPAFDRLAARLTTRAARLSRTVGLSNVDTFGQLAFIGTVLYLVALVVSHLPLVDAMMTSVSNMTPQQRIALTPENRPEYYTYRSWLDILVPLAGFAALRLARMRRRQPTQISAALLTAQLAALLVAATLWVAPYRLVMQSELPRVRLDSQRCFSLGHDAASSLIYCPDATQPKVQRVPDGDARLADAHVTESVFSAR